MWAEDDGGGAAAEIQTGDRRETARERGEQKKSLGQEVTNLTVMYEGGRGTVYMNLKIFVTSIIIDF